MQPRCSCTYSSTHARKGGGRANTVLYVRRPSEIAKRSLEEWAEGGGVLSFTSTCINFFGVKVLQLCEQISCRPTRILAHKMVEGGGGGMKSYRVNADQFQSHSSLNWKGKRYVTGLRACERPKASWSHQK